MGLSESEAVREVMEANGFKAALVFGGTSDVAVVVANEKEAPLWVIAQPIYGSDE